MSDSGRVIGECKHGLRFRSQCPICLDADLAAWEGRLSEYATVKEKYEESKALREEVIKLKDEQIALLHLKIAGLEAAVTTECRIAMEMTRQRDEWRKRAEQQQAYADSAVEVDDQRREEIASLKARIKYLEECIKSASEEWFGEISRNTVHAPRVCIHCKKWIRHEDLTYQGGSKAYPCHISCVIVIDDVRKGGCFGGE